MTALPIETYSKPIEGSDPCGEALDYDLSFLELEIAARGKPGHELGGSIVAPESPDWVQVDRLVRELSGKTKDLRVAVLATRAALNLGGIEGLRQSLEGLAIYVEEFWTSLHPRPDSEDADDEIVRLNALANLCDAEGLLAELRSVPLSNSRIFGTVTARDWLEAQKAITTPSDNPGVDIGTLESSFRDTPQEMLAATSKELGGTIAAIMRIDAAIRQKVEAVVAPSFEPLLDIVRQMQKVVDDHLPAVEAEGDIGALPSAMAPSSGIRDRSDVIGALESICRWYRIHEPSSPVPALLDRVKRVVAKDFMSLLLELAPNGAAEFRALAGLPPENIDQSIPAK